MHFDHQHFRFTLIYFSILSLILLSLALIIRHGNEVYIVNGAHTPWLDGYFALITNLGDALYFIPALLCLVFIRYGYAVIMLITGVAHALIITIFKRLLYPEAGRPISLLNIDQLYFVPGIDVYSKMSFPSGHTATAFAFLVLISLYWKNRVLSVLLSFIALSVGISRIYLLQHFGMDVAMGAVIGTTTALITYYTIYTGGMTGWMNKRLHVNKNKQLRTLALLRQRLNSRV